MTIDWAVRPNLTPREGDAYNSPSSSLPGGPPATGPVAEWPCRGLQIPVRRFDSGPGLQLNQ
jgi:hypothetical protein